MNFKMVEIKLSVIIPVLNEEKNISLVYAGLKEVLEKDRIFDFEIIFVNDGSRDGTKEEIEKLSAIDGRVKTIKFYRNLGKAAAYMAGFREARGEAIATMDGDLQDDPDDLIRLIKNLKDYDLVCGWKHSGKSSPAKLVASKFFNGMINLFVGLKLHDLNCSLKVYRAEVAKSLNLYGDLFRYVPILVNDLGYRIREIKVNCLPRKFGKSKYKSGKYFKSFLDFMTVYFLIRYSRKPLHFFGVAGILFGFVGTVIGVYLVLEKFLYNIEIMKEHGPLLVFTVLLIIVGFQMISFGLLAEMLTRIYQKSNT